MFYKTFLCILLMICLFINCSAEEDLPDTDTALASADVAAMAKTSLETNKSSILSCPGDYIDPPNCTQCASNYESKDGKCLQIKSELKPSSGSGRRFIFIFLACVLTVVLIIAMFVVYGRVSQQRRRRSSLNTGNISDSSNPNPNTRNRFNNILRYVGLNNLNKRRRFNFFSISNNNNNNSSGQYRQQESSRTPLNENPDEALLFDDPYADGGFNNSSANPYKSLTLAVT